MVVFDYYFRHHNEGWDPFVILEALFLTTERSIKISYRGSIIYLRKSNFNVNENKGKNLHRRCWFLTIIFVIQMKVGIHSSSKSYILTTEMSIKISYRGSIIHLCGVILTKINGK